MAKFLRDLKDSFTSFPLYRWGVSIGEAMGVKYSDSPTAKFLKKSVLNVIAPIATAWCGYLTALSLVALVTFPLAAAPLAALGSAAVGVLLNGLTTSWLAGMSEPGMKENINWLKSWVTPKKSYKHAAKAPARASAFSSLSNGISSKFAAVRAKVAPKKEKEAPTPRKPKGPGRISV